METQKIKNLSFWGRFPMKIRGFSAHPRIRNHEAIHFNNILTRRAPALQETQRVIRREVGTSWILRVNGPFEGPPASQLIKFSMKNAAQNWSQNWKLIGKWSLIWDFYGENESFFRFIFIQVSKRKIFKICVYCTFIKLDIIYFFI